MRKKIKVIKRFYYKRYWRFRHRSQRHRPFWSICVYYHWTITITNLQHRYVSHEHEKIYFISIQPVCNVLYYFWHKTFTNDFDQVRGLWLSQSKRSVSKYNLFQRDPEIWKQFSTFSYLFKNVERCWKQTNLHIVHRFCKGLNIVFISFILEIPSIFANWFCCIFYDKIFSLF